MSAPAFHAGLKLAWIEQIIGDHGSSDFQVRVAAAISRRVDKRTGEAVDLSQDAIAKFIGGTERGVRKATEALQERDHLEIRRSGKGRGFVARYRPLLKGKNGGSGIDSAQTDENRNGGSGIDGAQTDENRNDDSGIDDAQTDENRNGGSGINGAQTDENRNGGSGKSKRETRNDEAENPERRSRKPGTVVPILPFKNPFKNPSARRGYPPESSDPLQVSWRAIRKQLEGRLGADKVRAWLDPLTVEKIEDDAICFIAPTKFFASYSSTHHGDLILSAWRRSIQPSLKRVHFRLPSGREPIDRHAALAATAPTAASLDGPTEYAPLATGRN